MQETTHAASGSTFSHAFIEKPRRARRRWQAAWPVLCITLSACGGGGGGGGVIATDPVPPPVVIPPVPVTPTPACYQTAEFGCLSESAYQERREEFAATYRNTGDFSNQWGLAAINADQAYADLRLAKGENAAPGEGVTVGLIDTGIDQEHPLFQGQTIEETRLLGAMDERGGTFSHGTAVASVIAAQSTGIAGRDGIFQGVAWGADLKMFAIRLGEAPPDYDPISLDDLRSANPVYEDLYGEVLASGMDILNLSFTFLGNIESYTEQDIRYHFGQTITALAQEGRQEKTILVWAAGNSHGLNCIPGSPHCRSDGSVNASSPELLAGLVARIEELRGHSIAAVAVDQSGAIADFSNRCGIVAEWCLAAPGDNVRIAYFGPGPNTGLPGVRGTSAAPGTSFAAPMISGGLALMKQLFRDQLANPELVKRLFATANKTGRYADRTIYGQGMMDLGAATNPVGEPTVALGNRVGGTAVSLQATNLSLGGALGDGLGRSLAGQEIVAFDSLGAPFWFKLSDFLGNTNGPSSLFRLYELMEETPITQQIGGQLTTFTQDRIGGSIEQDLGYARLQFGFLRRPGDRIADVENGHLSLVRDATTLTLTGEYGLAVTAFSTAGLVGRAPTSGVSLSWRPVNGPVGLRTGWLTEQDTLLGTRTNGAFGTLSGNAVFAGLETDGNFGEWQLAADVDIGTLAPRLQDGIVTDMSNLTTSAFALRATRRLLHGGSVTITLAQPLRVETGQAALSIPVGRTKEGDVVVTRLGANLVPSGRQVEVSAQWHRPLADAGELRFGAAWTHNPGHNANADPALRVLAGWGFEF